MAPHPAMGLFTPGHYRIPLPFAGFGRSHNAGVRILRLTLACATLAAAAPAARADIFSFIDEQGIAHYSNVPNDARFELMLKSAPQQSEAGARISPMLLAKSAQYDHMIERSAQRTSVDAALLRAVIVVESGFDPRAVSRVGARGLMQLMPATARSYGVSNVFDPAQNIHGGARLLRDLLKRYDNDIELALAAYNAGVEAVTRYGGQIPPFKETRLYVPRVMKVYRALTEQSRDTGNT